MPLPSISAALRAALQPYFTFSRAHRRVMLTLAMVYLAGGGILWWWAARPVPVHWQAAQVAWLQQQAMPGMAATGNGSLAAAPVSGMATGLFFDPNTADSATLIAAGMPAPAVRGLLRYRSKGGRLRQAADLRKLYALSPQQAEALIPFVQIAAEKSPTALPPLTAGAEQPLQAPARIMIDINKADSVEMQALPMVGAKRAGMIVRYRESLGGFINPEQLTEVWGITDTVLQKMKPFIRFTGANPRRLDLNTATEADLKQHPYIRWQLAKLIIAYRQQHGPYNSVNDLLKIHVVEEPWLQKVKPYLQVQGLARE
ncbi:MAG: helix-hairpin-helix domain-containing protein [Chitinophagaceae bacterium]|nr:helix-hairpin-helix domain-containing protein [Chitinophagaceae bacterium]